MARPLRIEQIGHWYHVTARGNERRKIFQDARARRHFLERLEEAVSMFALRLHGYVLKSKHYHLLIELTEKKLSRAIHWLNVSYCVWFNRRHGRSVHLFQGRFKSVVVEPEAWGLEASRYLHLNPVRLARFGLGKRISNAAVPWALKRWIGRRCRNGLSGCDVIRGVRIGLHWERQAAGVVDDRSGAGPGRKGG